ncbi:MAG: LamG-like jellyroll fold domain-containing protein [bacterium]|nr:LamG-like jellyroll fold domain-containing protein [bacterium]
MALKLPTTFSFKVFYLLCLSLILQAFTPIATYAQGTYYVPSSHITGVYQNCIGKVKIKVLYQDVGNWGASSIVLYYKNSSGNFVSIMQLYNNLSYSNGWSDNWVGSSRNYSYTALSGATLSNGYKTNEGSLHYFDFYWNVPADAYANNIITLASSGTAGFATWAHTTSSSSSIVTYPILSPPSPVEASDQVHCGKVALSWQLPGSFPCSYNYQVFRNNSLYTTVAGNLTDYDDTNVGNEVNSYKIKAVHSPTSGGSIQSIFSNSANGSKKLGLSAPAAITVSDNDCGGSINVSWSYYLANPLNFKVYESTTSTGAGTLVGTIDGGDRTFQRTAPSRNTNYYYKISTVGICGETFSTNSYPGMSPTTPNAPSNVRTSVNGSNTGIVVRWNDNSSDENAFIIERSLQGGGSSTLFNVPTNDTVYVDYDASKCVNYTYNIRARNNCQPGGVPASIASTNRMFPELANSFNGTSNKLKCSKGYFPNMIQLEWSTVNVDVINQYRIFRKIFGSTSDSTIIGTAAIGEGTFVDYSVASGVLYKYTIVGVLSCAGTVRYSNITEDVGFRSASGIVSGRITYQGGFALRNAKVMVAPSSSINLGASILFSGAGQLTVPTSTTLSFTSGITTENWFKTPLLSGTQTMLDIRSGSKSYKVSLVNNTIQVIANNGSTTRTATSTSTYLANNFNQVTTSLRSDSLYIYLNGIKAAGISLTGFTLLPLNNSNIFMGNSFNGNLDEIRFYNAYKTKEDVVADYGRKVNPNDLGLLAYYMFDENVLGYNGFFDYSKNGNAYNENHGTMTGASFSSFTPSTSQLAFASYTDETGSYVVTNIGFTSSGQVFTVTPSFETHLFSPVNRTVFIGEGSIVISQQDFIDQSSFEVSGTVFYNNSSCPMEGANFKIDGELVVKNGVAASSNNLGAFNIQVPVGNHVITVLKEGHIFNKGRFPSSGAYDFQGVVADIQFKDSTLIKVVGRAVGGAIEASKKPGLGLSVNNIGKTRLHFKSQLGGGCSRVSVTTNDTTGEYVAYLLPLIYTIDTMKVLTNPVAGFGIQSVLDLSNTTKLQQAFDTTYIGGTALISKIDSVSFHVRKDFIYYTNPQLSFSRMFNRTATDTSFIGELAISIDSVTSIPLAPINPFVYPVFKQYKDYSARVFAYDEYQNNDRSPVVKYKVPLDGVLQVINDLAALEQDTMFTQVSNGSAVYSFRAASPEMSRNPSNDTLSFTRTIQATFFTQGNTGYRNVNWLPNSGSTPFRGIVFGGRSTGSNFITKGPEKVDLILRDPPGSASSSTWAKNTSYNSIKRYSTLNNTGGSFMGTVQVGAKWETGVAAIALFAIESEIAGSGGFGVTKETTAGTNGELVESMSSAISISTGSSSDQVGANADIFFGHSTNYTIGLANNLMLVSDAVCAMPNSVCGGVGYNGYRIGIKQSLSVNPNQIQTIFAYTTGEIEGIVIPNLVKVRNLILTQGKKSNGQNRYSINFTDTDDPNYEKKYGANNDDPVWLTSRNNNNALTEEPIDSTGPSYTFKPDRQYDIDSVRMMNSQIRLWKEALARNEREKYLGFELGIGVNLTSGSNLSIGKASITREFTSTRSKEETSYEEVYLAHDEAYNFHATSGGSGLIFDGSLTLGETKVHDNGSSADSSVTISYTLNDGDDGDLISVSVLDPGTGNGHMFKMIGGQTSCPYEGIEWAHYYKPGDSVRATTKFEDGQSVKITNGTAQRHVPKISIPQPVKYNVPADQPATFTLQLGNESESEDDQTYKLQIVEVSNPNGAVITIDGLDPNREFTVPYATSVFKTLRITRGVEHYDYNNILILFKSPCNDEIVDSAYVTVHFIPTCTPSVIYSPGDKWTLNNSFQDTMNVIITGYDYNFGGFKDVTFQYKPSSSAVWNILETFKKVSAGADDKIIPTILPYIEYKWNMKQLVDGPYDIRAVSTCTAPGYADAKKESNVYTGLSDRVNPSPFGTPSPADGILSPNDEIQIQFNEPVDNASLTYQNFDIRGVLNGSALQNTASLYFDGDNDYLEIPTGLNLNSKTFSLEFWAKRQGLGEQVVFSQGIDNVQFMSIGFDDDNKFNFRIGNNFVRSNLATVDTLSFHHFTVSYNSNSDLCELFIDGVISNTGNTNIYNKYLGGGKTIIGKLSKTNNLFYKGNLRDFRLWSKVRTSSEILSSINLTLRGTEAGILANWRMDEADGSVVNDYVRARHATIFNAVWEINPKGKSYRMVNEPIEIGAADLAFTEEKDFTIEFWFKGNNTAAPVALFSNGRGDSTDSNPFIKWSIEKDVNGKIFVKHRGFNFEAVSNNYFNGNWHHFALVMQRATSMVVYVDGNQQNSVYPSDFKQFGGSKIWLGGRGYQLSGSAEVVDRKFDGYMDEVRIWNSARKVEQINRDRVNRLSGTESDLIFYLPFELYTLNLGVPILTGNLSDIKSPTRGVNGTTALGSGLSSESPKIKLQRPVQAINFSYSINQDKIILTPTTLPALIENVTLDITVKDIFDLNGNKMQSPKTWIAYVDKNQVKWQDQDFNFTKKKGEALIFNTNIVNSGGAIKQFNLQNLPSWISANPASGTITPNSYKTIIFTIDPNVNIGSYENEIQLLTDFGFPDGLLVKMKVYADLPSSWVVNPAIYSNSMSIIGQLRINNVISTNPDDKISVFVNGVCRGIASLQYFPQIDRYYAFLNVYSNVSSGETLQFKIWNAGEGKIHSDVTPDINFISNSQVGSVSAPQVFNASDKLTRYIPINTGWNWLSFNLLMRDSNNINALFKDLNSSNGNIIRNQTQFADYSNLNGWVGSLSNTKWGLKPQSMYSLKSVNFDTLAISGVEIDPTTRPINLDSGWNWIGYISQRNLSTTEAFSSLSASSGDLIKSQTQFAVYDPIIGWVGSLTTMIPNKGYMFRSGSNATFAYPKSAMFGKTNLPDNEYMSNFFKLNPSQFEFNMNAVIQVGVCEEALSSGRFSVAAYKGNELRGVTKISRLDNGSSLYFLNMGANYSEELNFRLLDEQTGNSIELDGTANFKQDLVVGSIKQPLFLAPTNNFNCQGYVKGATSKISLTAYPNPFTHGITLSISGMSDPKLEVSIYDVTGKLVDRFTSFTNGTSNNNIDWNPASRGTLLESGFYFVEVSNSKELVRTKIIKY